MTVASRSPATAETPEGATLAVTVKVAVAVSPRSSVAVIVTGSRPSGVCGASDHVHAPPARRVTVPIEAERLTVVPGSVDPQPPLAVIAPPTFPETEGRLADTVGGVGAGRSLSVMKTISGRT